MSEPLNPQGFQELAGLDDAALARCATYLDLLQKWQPKLNLVGPKTLDDPWRRHLLDSAQLLPLLPEGTHSLADLGSGAGLPGLILALLSVPEVTLIEADRRKSVFLREAARVCGVDVTVRAERLESIAPAHVDVVTARALAPLDKLLGLALPFLGPKTRCLFLKGAKVDDELTEARSGWTMQTRKHPSLSDRDGAVLECWDVRQR